MPETYEAKCPGCGSPVYHDKETWCKCDICGEPVYFKQKYRKQFGNPVSPIHSPDPWDESNDGSEPDENQEIEKDMEPDENQESDAGEDASLDEWMD